jgi:hypothetical protein
MKVPVQPLAAHLEPNHVVVNNNLKISFHRTIRVPDNHKASALPPDLGKFPLEATSKYIDKLSEVMLAKGGVFLPMYRQCSPIQDTPSQS